MLFHDRIDRMWIHNQFAILCIFVIYHNQPKHMHVQMLNANNKKLDSCY